MILCGLRVTLSALSRAFIRHCLHIMPLKTRHIRQLRSLAHHCKPVVIMGAAGLSAAVLAEIDLALAQHELIKVRVNAADRTQREAFIADITQQTRAEVVQRIGHIAAFYRRAEKPVITLR